MAAVSINLAPPRTRWSTFRLLKTARAVLLVLDALLLVTILSATAAHRAALRTVGKDAAPSIIAAQHIRSAMADMDADAANELLTPAAGALVASKGYEARRIEAMRALIGAAENITYGDAERLPIESLQVGLGTYESLVQTALDLRAEDRPGWVAAYRQAANVMDTVLLPSAEALDRANNVVLERTYRRESLRSSGARWLIVVFALGTVGVLLLTQGMLSQRMRRTLNPPLLLATFLVLAISLTALHALSRSHEALRVAREDAFTSVHALWRARATAYAANAEESRFLLDSGHAADHARAFAAAAATLAAWPEELTGNQLIAALRNGGRVDGFSGFLADELNNVTFPGERRAALETLAAWQHYLAVDAQIRKLARDGDERQAINLCTGSAPGQSDWAFARFDAALGQTLVINQSAFDGAVREGNANLGRLQTEAVFAALLAAALVIAGIAPRIREYR